MRSDVPTAAAHSSLPPAGPLERGASFDRYTVLEKLGEGGMGDVYAAYDRKLDRKIALKVLRRKSGEYQQRFEREAQAMARLSHPNVVAVFDTGIVDGRLFVAMEFVQGGTLKTHQRAAKRSHKEVLALYLEAGRGLAAAHEAGLVHRDFKPDNVLVSSSGQVKVTDFGIARALGETSQDRSPRAAPADEGRPPLEATPPPPLTSSLQSPLTQDGAMLGTPGYMAPEQYTSDLVDERTDQFAFCVALYAALYGERPFSGKSVNELAQATLLGELRDAPKGTAVPMRLRRVLLRGLSTERKARYPSMQALLDELVRDPARQRRRVAAAVGAVAVVVASAVGAARVAAVRQAQLCAGGEAEERDAWNPDTEARIESAFLATGLPYAADAWRRTREQVDGYMQKWTAAYRQTCEATRVHQDQSEQVMIVRMACLERRRDEVRALAEVLSGADREVVSKAVQASMGLTSVDQCKDVVSLTAVVPEPTDGASATEIGAIRRELATVAASIEAGKSSAARLEVEPLVGRARRIGYSPLLAEVILASVKAKGASGTAREVILGEGAEAVFEADRGRAESTRAEAATRLMGWAIEAGRYDEAERWSRIAEAALERTGDDGQRKAAWLAAVASLAYQRGHYEEYADKAQQALDIARRAGAGGARISAIEEILANAQALLGHQGEAERLALEADDIVVRSLGEDHPARIQSLSAISFVIGQVNDYRKALGYELEAIALAERVQPDHGRLPLIYNNTCWDLLKLGDRAGALHYCQEAVDRGLPIYGPDSVDLAYAYTSLGDVLFELHRYDEAIESGQKALAIYEKNPSALDTNCVHVFTGVGQAQILAGRAREGLASLERAVALSAKVAATSGEGQGFVADAHFALAKALWQAGVRTARIVDLARTAEQTYERASNLDGAHEVQTWMADHRLG